MLLNFGEITYQNTKKTNLFLTIKGNYLIINCLMFKNLCFFSRSHFS